MTNETAMIEALLFAAGEPLTKEKISEITDIGIIEITKLLRELEKELEGHGIILREVATGWQLSTRPKYFSIIEKLAETSTQKFSSAMMETLSIIAFKQPVTRIEIEEIRGVNVDRSLAKLLEIEFVEEVGRKQVIGRPILYGTTENFLKSFGIKNLKELPKISN